VQIWLQWNSSITCSDCVFVALGIHHEMRMCHFHLWFTRLYIIFPLYLIKARFLKKKLLNIKCGFWSPLQLLSEIERDMIQNIHWSSCKLPVVLTSFNGAWIFSIYFRKIYIFQISWNSFHWEPSCSMCTDGRTDVTKLIVAFRHFAKASEL